MGIRAMAGNGRGWLTACFTMGAVVTGTASPAHAKTPTGPRPVDAGRKAANDNEFDVCIADMDVDILLRLTGFRDEAALRQASALIREMNMRNGTPIAVLAILEASDRTGVSFELLIAKAIAESRLGVFDAPIGVNGSARGVFQFMPATWLTVFHDYGAQYGDGQYKALAAQIQFDANKTPFVTDKDVETEILALRSDPRVAAFVKALYLRDEETPQLRRMLNRDPRPVDYYMLHLLGHPRASVFYRNLARSPNASVLPAFAREARFNQGVFYTPRNRARTYKQVYDHLGGLMQSYIALVRNSTLRAESEGACVKPLVFGQEPPPPAPLPVPIPVPRPPQEEIDRLLARRPAANDIIVTLPLRPPIPTPRPAPG